MNENSSTDRPLDESVPGDKSPVDEPPGDEATTPTVRQGTGLGKKIVWLAVILIAGALAAAGYLYFDKAGDEDLIDPKDQQIATLSSSLDASRKTVEALEARLAELAANAAARDLRFEAIENRFADRLTRLDSLPGRIGNLESSMASLRGMSSGLRDSWLLAEAEYYMQIANAQLQLAGNPKLAILALRLADEKIQQLANPALTDVRRALAGELRALSSINSPDIEGIALTLSSLATVVDSLPLDNDIDTRDKPDTPVDAELSGMARVLASIRKTAADVVSVRRSDVAVRPLIAPEAQYFLRANLALQFQAARIALLRGQQTLFDQSLDDAASWLNRYYDTSSAPVQSVLQTMSEVRQNVMPVSLPDISASLRLLREYRLRSAAGAQAPAEEEPAADPGAGQ